MAGWRAIRERGPTRPAGDRLRWRAGAATLLAVVLLVSLLPHGALGRPRAGIGSQVALTPPQTTIGFWAGEAVPGTDWSAPETYWNRRATRAYTPRLWRVLRRHGIPLYFNLRYRRDFGAVPPGMPRRNDALRIIRTANRLGVPVWGWVLIPYSDGYWAWEGAAAQQFKAVRALVHWMRRKRVRLEGLAIDPEPRLLTPFEASMAILGGGGNHLLDLLRGPVLDPAGQCAAWRIYARIPRWARRHNVRVSAAPMPTVLDDVDNRSIALQDAADFVLPRAPWHELYFQAYRSVFAYYLGHDPGSGIVASYFRSAQREFGDRGQITLGSTGRGPYRRFASLLRDVRLAATLGARHVPIYSLERSLRAYGGPRSIARLARAARHPLSGSSLGKSSKANPRTRAVRGAIRRVDRIATISTQPVTESRGSPQSPNRWPDGCREPL